MRESRLWTPEQISAVRENVHLTDAEIVEIVNRHGPARTIHAVKCTRQKTLGIKKLARSADHASGGRKSDEIAAGWPVLPGTPEERHERYCALVMSEFVRLYPERVAA